MKKLATATCIVLGLATFSSPSLATSVNIAGTQSLANYHPVIDTSVLFNPNNGPVTATGTIDISSLGSGALLFIGLISKVDYDLHFNFTAAPFGHAVGDTSADFLDSSIPRMVHSQTQPIKSQAWGSISRAAKPLRRTSVPRRRPLRHLT